MKTPKIPKSLQGQSHFIPSENTPSYNTSPFPALEIFITEGVGKRGGVDGSIRSWYYETNHQEQIICYNMKDNRFCEQIGRHHKQNHIIWNIDLIRGVYWHTCRDPRCYLFQGQHIVLPTGILNSLSSNDASK